MTEKTQDILEIVKQKTEELLANLGFEAKIEVEQTEETVFTVRLDTEESGLLIGYHGEMLSSFQIILGLLVFRATGSWVRIFVEIGDYRERREEQLNAMADSYAKQAVSTGEPVYLPYLSPAERRIVHMALQDRQDVTTESEGMGRQRRLMIKPRV